MTRVYILCEGQTEETFVRQVLAPYFALNNTWLEGIVFGTSAQQKGGVVSFAQVKKQIIDLCKHDPAAYVTTLIDYYGLPGDFPKLNELKQKIKANPHQHIVTLEQAFSDQINQANFIANFMLHEYEAYLFTDTGKFELWFDDNKQLAQLAQIKQQFDTPEHINNSQHTAPSKRLLKTLPNYKKTLHGPDIAELIGIDPIRKQCPHFDQWLKQIAALG